MIAAVPKTIENISKEVWWDRENKESHTGDKGILLTTVQKLPEQSAESGLARTKETVAKTIGGTKNHTNGILPILTKVPC